MTTSSSRRTIGIVADRQAVLSLPADALEMLGSRLVVTAVHPDDGPALGEANADPIDLVLTDVPGRGLALRKPFTLDALVERVAGALCQ